MGLWGLWGRHPVPGRECGGAGQEALTGRKVRPGIALTSSPADRTHRRGRGSIMASSATRADRRPPPSGVDLGQRHRRGLDGFTEMFEDTLNGIHLGDGGDDSHRFVTAGAGEREDLHARRAQRPLPGPGFHRSRATSAVGRGAELPRAGLSGRSISLQRDLLQLQSEALERSPPPSWATRQRSRTSWRR